MEFEIYQDGSVTYVCMGMNGFEGIFIYRKYPPDRDEEWDFFAPKQPRMGRRSSRNLSKFPGSKIDSEDFLKDFPPLPEPPSGLSRSWKENFLPEKPLKVSEYPLVFNFLQDKNLKGTEVFIVLYEDLYETSLGDGKFHYFQEAFLTTSGAENYVEKETGAFHLRTMTIEIAGDEFSFPDFDPQIFDRYYPKDVIAALEKRIADEEAN